MLTKITRQPFHDIQRESFILELVHTDLCDFHSTPSFGNKKYVVTYIDYCTQYCYVYLLHAKDYAPDKFGIYNRDVETQKGVHIKRLCTNRGGKYVDPIFLICLKNSRGHSSLYTSIKWGIRKEESSVKGNG